MARTRKRSEGRKTVQQQFDIRPYLPLLSLLFLAFLLRVPTLTFKSLWFDEVRSYDYVTSGRILSQTVHPLAFWLMKLSLGLGGTGAWVDFLLRLPSAIAGILSVLFMYLVAERIGDRKLGLISGILIALSVYNVWYSQEARYYALMMCFALASLYFMVLFLQQRKMWQLLLFLVVAAAQTKVHLTTKVLSLAQGVFLLLWWLTRKDVYRYFSLKGLRESFGTWGWRVPIAGLLIIMLGAMGALHFLKEFSRIDPGRLLGESGLSPGVSFSKAFFMRHFMEYTGLWLSGRGLYSVLGKWMYAIAIVMGVVWLLRRFRLYGVFFIFVTVSSFTAVFLTFQRVEYSTKYISYLQPYLLLCAGVGIWSLSQLSKRKSPAYLWLTRISWGIFVLIVLYGCGSLWIYYRGAWMDFKGAAKTFWKERDTNGVIALEALSHYALEYYFETLRYDQRALKDIAYLRIPTPIALHRLKTLMAQYPDVWYLESWYYDDPKGIMDEVKRYFSPVWHSKALRGMYCSDARLWRFDYPHIFVYPTRTFSEDVNFSVREESDILWKENIFFDVPGLYTVSVEATPFTLLEDAVLRIDERFEIPFTLQTGHLRAPFEITSEGLHSIAVVRHEASGTGQHEQGQVRIFPDYQKGVTLQSEWVDEEHPTIRNFQKNITTVDGRTCLVMDNNTFARYIVDLPYTSAYSLALKAKSPPTLPPLLEVVINGDPVGIVTFDQRDDLFHTMVVPFKVRSGQHTIELYMVNALKKWQVDEKVVHSVAVLDSISLQTIESLDSIESDVIDYRDMLLKLEDTSALSFEGFESGKLAPGWQLISPSFSMRVRDTESTNKKEVGFEVTPVRAEGGLLTPVFEVKARKILYFSLRITTERLMNHTANSIVIYWDKNGDLLLEEWVNNPGVQKDGQRVRQCYFGVVPDGARSAQIGFWVYPNTQMPEKSTGRAWFSDFRFEGY